MIEEVSAGGVVINKGNVLMVFQNKSQTWSLPKGHVEEGESVEATARREIYEETGVIDLTFVKELGSYIRGTKKRPNLRKKIIILQFLTDQEEIKSMELETGDVKWVPIDEVYDLLDYEKDKDFFLRIKDLI